MMTLLLCCTLWTMEVFAQSTFSPVIKCKAAVAWGPNQPLVIEDIEVDPPNAAEVRIKIVSTGLCHSDAHAVDGTEKVDFPCILGHEGAGIVESVGQGVTTVKEGDHVIPLCLRTCGECEYCKSPDTNLCTRVINGKSSPTMRDGTKRFTCRGMPLSHFMGTSTFSQYTVCSETDVAKVSNEAPFNRICLIGCAIPTGYGAAINTAKVKPGSTCAVWGLGGVGLATVMGCKDSGAAQIIGVDINPQKFDHAKTFGATECLDPKAYARPIHEVISELTQGGCDFTFECVGNLKAMRAAFDSSHKGWGKTTIVGMVGHENELSINPFDLVLGKHITGSVFGGYEPRKNVPKLVEKYMRKELMLNEFVTCEKPFKEINEGFHLMHLGKTIRTVINLFE